MLKQRKNTKIVRIGNVNIGCGAPVAVQSMCNINADRPDELAAQATALKEAGCNILRVAVPDKDSVFIIDKIKSAVDIPLVADIHFDYRIALECAAAGIDKIRINPGNIGDESRVGQVAKTCRDKGIPIRIGVNSGSVEKNILAKYGGPTADALVESAEYHSGMLHKFDFDNIVLSVKSSEVSVMIEAYTKLSEKFDYPLHLGVTEAGTPRSGIAKSAMGIGYLLLNGIGDTIRVSLTSDPIEEIPAAYDILQFAGYDIEKPEIISCPTCGRTQIDLIKLTWEIERRALKLKRKIKIAVMGCAVNGPGEAKEADFGICGGADCALIIKKGEIIKKVPFENAADELFMIIEN